MPVELVIITYNELRSEHKRWSLEEAIRKARDAARKSVEDRLPEEVIVERLFYEEDKDDDSWEIRAVAETRENIARQRPME